MDYGARVYEPSGESFTEGRRYPESERCAWVPHRDAQEVDAYGRYLQVLSGARDGVEAGQDFRRGADRRRARVHGHRHFERREYCHARSRSRRPCEAGGPAADRRATGERNYRSREAYLYVYGRAAQRGDWAARDVDGTGVPAGGRGFTALRPDPAQYRGDDGACFRA